MGDSRSSKDEATQVRIINHMNTDHQDSLIRYLRHYHHLSSFSARNANLIAIDFSALTLSTSAFSFSFTKTYRIPFNPPLTSWADVRPRVVAMDGEACSGLACSPITVKRYVPPHGVMALIFAASLWTELTFCRRAHFVPGSLYYEAVFKYVPHFAAFCHKIQPWFFYTMISLHGAQVVYVERSRLRKHTVRMMSDTWFKWLLSDFIEGFGAIFRFDRLVREEEEKKQKQKH